MVKLPIFVVLLKGFGVLWVTQIALINSGGEESSRNVSYTLNQPDKWNTFMCQSDIYDNWHKTIQLSKIYLQASSEVLSQSLASPFQYFCVVCVPSLIHFNQFRNTKPCYNKVITQSQKLIFFPANRLSKPPRTSRRRKF